MSKSSPSPLDAYCFLSYAEREPHLRVVSPGSGRSAVAPAQVIGADSALDNMLLRDGWVCINNNNQVWSMPLPMVNPARLVATSFRAVPAADSRHVWVCPVDTPGKAVCIDKDGAVVEIGSLPPGCALDAICGDSWFVRRLDDGLTFVSDASGKVRRDLGVGSVVTAACKTVVLKRHHDVPLFVDRDGQRVLNPERRYWFTLLDIETLEERQLGTDRSPRSADVSPDGSRIVVIGSADDGRSASVSLFDGVSGEMLSRHDRFDHAGFGCWTRDARWYFFQNVRVDGASVAWCLESVSHEIRQLSAADELSTFAMDATGLELGANPWQG